MQSESEEQDLPSDPVGTGELVEELVVVVFVEVSVMGVEMEDSVIDVCVDVKVVELESVELSKEDVLVVDTLVVVV